VQPPPHTGVGRIVARTGVRSWSGPLRTKMWSDRYSRGSWTSLSSQAGTPTGHTASAPPRMWGRLPEHTLLPESTRGTRARRSRHTPPELRIRSAPAGRTGLGTHCRSRRTRCTPARYSRRSCRRHQTSRSGRHPRMWARLLQDSSSGSPLPDRRERGIVPDRSSKQEGHTAAPRHPSTPGRSTAPGPWNIRGARTAARLLPHRPSRAVRLHTMMVAKHPRRQTGAGIPPRCSSSGRYCTKGLPHSAVPLG
jgi:hypothetical protein